MNENYTLMDRSIEIEKYNRKNHCSSSHFVIQVELRPNQMF